MDVKATRAQTLTALFKKSKTQRAGVRRVFVQQGTQKKPKPGPLARLVRGRHVRALDLLLLAHALATNEPFAARYGADVWARALGITGPASRVAISRAWTVLEKRRLVSRKRFKRLNQVTLLLEDGSGHPYTKPGLTSPAPVEDVYFQVPLAYWYDEWHTKLSLAAKAVLLIALSLPDGFTLPADKGPAWYGISRDTVAKGLGELHSAGILIFRLEQRTAPLLPAGVLTYRRYSLRPPFRRRKGALATVSMKATA